MQHPEKAEGEKTRQIRLKLTLFCICSMLFPNNTEVTASSNRVFCLKGKKGRKKGKPTDIASTSVQMAAPRP